MKAIAWVIVIVVVIVVVAAVLLALRQRSRARLQRRFGPEYERAVERTGNRREAEQQLAEVAKKRDTLDIRELEPASRQRYTQQWDQIQTRFVDAPADAVGSASTLITSVMRERGYPTDDFDQRASLVATDHPDVVEHYREAQSAYDRHRHAGQGDTEDLRQAFVHYRALFSALVGDDDDRDDRDDRVDRADRADRVDRADRTGGDRGHIRYEVAPEAGTRQQTTREAGGGAFDIAEADDARTGEADR